MDDRRHRFEVQVMPHLDAAHRFARWLARSPDEADDVVQEAILRAFRGFDGLRGSDVKAWLLRIVRNCHLTALQQQQRIQGTARGSPSTCCSQCFFSAKRARASRDITVPSGTFVTAAISR